MNNSKKLLVLFLILIFAFLIRVINLGSLPIFTDEAIYIRWSQIANADPAWRFISLTDGKQPLFIWLNIINQRLISDPLLAGRLVSALAGTFSALGLFLLGKILFNWKTGLFSALIWAIFPFALWHDRLALMDSLLACFTVWALWLEVFLVRSLRLDVALILGIVSGLALLTKSSAQFILYLLPFSLILAPFKIEKKFLKWLGLVILASLLALSIDSLQRLSPFYYIIGLKNLTFIYSSSEIFSFSFWQNWQRFWGNLRGLSFWLSSYFSFSFLFLILISLVRIKKKLKEKIYLLFCFLFPFLSLAFFGKVLYPRFLLFMTLPLIVLCAESLVFLFRMRKFLYFILIFVFLYPLYFDIQILFNIVNAPLPAVDRGQYLDDWPAGWGIKEVSEYLKEKAKTKEIALATEGTFGLTPAALEIYLNGEKNIEIKGFWPINDGVSWWKEKAQEKETYVLFKDTQKPNSEWSLQLIAKYKRGKGDNFLSLYLVK